MVSLSYQGAYSPRTRNCVLVILILMSVVALANISMYSVLARRRFVADVNVSTESHVGVRRNIIIVLWTPLLQGRFKGGKSLSHCPAKGCFITKDQGYQPNADLVLFHGKDLVGGKMADLPFSHPSHQYWAYVMMESPVNSYRAAGARRRFRQYDTIFNLTMTYATQSELWTPYGGYHRRAAPISNLSDVAGIYGNKSKLVLWYVSHCVHHRARYANVLKKYVSVDIYGACGQKDPCHRNTECLSRLKNQYKFYLAFENSVCKDYITEKFWLALLEGMVPIAMGTSIADYERVAPPNSFLHVDNFTSPQHLADYLTYLDRNESAYGVYHAWRRDYAIDHTGFWCRVCKAARGHLQPKRYVITNYWSFKSMCKPVESHPILGKNYAHTIT